MNDGLRIVDKIITRAELKDLAQEIFGDFVKAVVDINRGIMAINAELHVDLEAHLLSNGSRQVDLWGINLYPDLHSNDFIEFDSMINIRPSQNNRSRFVEDENIRSKIVEIVRNTVPH